LVREKQKIVQDLKDRDNHRLEGCQIVKDPKDPLINLSAMYRYQQGCQIVKDPLGSIDQSISPSAQQSCRIVKDPKDPLINPSGLAKDVYHRCKV
jgi:hypothetical protein